MFYVILMHTCSIDDDRGVLVDVLVDGGGVGGGEIEAAVGAAALVDLAAESLAPRGVVQADVAVEGHPVLDLGVVALAAQHGVARLVRQAVNAFRRRVPLRRIARDEIALKDAFAVLIKPELLRGEARLDVSRAPVLPGMDGRRLRVDGLAGRALLRGEQLQKMRHFLLLVDAPAVIALRNLDVLPRTRVEFAHGIGRVVFVGQLLDEGLDLLLVEGNAGRSRIVLPEPRDDAVARERFALVAERVGNRDARVILLRLLKRRRRRQKPGCGRTAREAPAKEYEADDEAGREESGDAGE